MKTVEITVLALQSEEECDIMLTSLEMFMRFLSKNEDVDANLKNSQWTVAQEMINAIDDVRCSLTKNGKVNNKYAMV